MERYYLIELHAGGSISGMITRKHDSGHKCLPADLLSCEFNWIFLLRGRIKKRGRCRSGLAKWKTIYRRWTPVLASRCAGTPPLIASCSARAGCSAPSMRSKERIEYWSFDWNEYSIELFVQFRKINWAIVRNFSQNQMLRESCSFCIFLIKISAFLRNSD